LKLAADFLTISLYNKRMTISILTAAIKQKMSMAMGLSSKVVFDLGDDGVIFVDATKNPPVITNEKPGGDVDLTLSCKADVLDGILNGTQDPNMAFMMGKLKVQGSMGLAMKLNAILED
jgi:putative sterol carrier protein